MKIALVIGHSRKSQGSMNKSNITEYAMFKTYLHTVKGFLPQQCEYRVFERKDDSGTGYYQRIHALTAEVNEWGADLVMSFHFNSYSNDRVEGFEVLTTSYEKSRDYARMLLSYLEPVLYGDNRGNKVINRGDRGYWFLQSTNSPTMLIEGFFGSSKSDTDNFFDTLPSFTQALGVFINRLGG